MWFTSPSQWQARRTLQALQTSWRSASAGEDRWLAKHLKANSRSLFGLAHRFSEISTSTDFERAVSLRPLADVDRAVVDLRRGLQRTLTVEQPACIAVSEEGSLPMAEESLRSGVRLWQLWASEVEQAYPGALAGGVAVLPESGAGRGLRTRGIPSLAGEFAVPWVSRRQNAVPSRVAAVQDSTLRAFLAARFALARDVTLLSARSAADLVAFAKTIQAHAPSLIRAIHDGTLGIFACEQPRLCLALGRELRPDPARARELERAMEGVGSLRPADAWPRLKVLAVHSGAAARGALWPWYGDRALVGAGMFVGAERIGLPTRLPDGPCALVSPGLVELLPVSGGAAVRQHQLREGEVYRVVLTTPGGLYRAVTDSWVRCAGHGGDAVLVEPCDPPPPRRFANPHLAS